MSLMKEFREFAVKGNVVDMAVGIIVGAAFGTIVKSLVDDIIMPPIGLLLGNVDFSDLFVVLKAGESVAPPYETLEAAKSAGAVTLNYGQFVSTVITFLIVSWSVFLLVKTINRLRRQDQAAPATPTDKSCPFCTLSIPVAASRCPHCTSELTRAAAGGG